MQCTNKNLLRIVSALQINVGEFLLICCSFLLSPSHQPLKKSILLLLHLLHALSLSPLSLSFSFSSTLPLSHVSIGRSFVAGSLSPAIVQLCNVFLVHHYQYAPSEMPHGRFRRNKEKWSILYRFSPKLLCFLSRGVENLLNVLEKLIIT